MKPILFNTEMVRAILDGRKTVTRRVVKLKYSNTHLEMFTNKYGSRLIEKQNEEPGVTTIKHPDGTTTHKLLACIEKTPPYCSGDILYVRETWATKENLWSGMDTIIYRADAPEMDVKWRPSIHMPRAAARIFLRVTDVRVERLQEITVEDILREGVDVELPPICKQATDPNFPTAGQREAWKKMNEAQRDEYVKTLTTHTYIGWLDYADRLFLHMKNVWNSTIKPVALALYGWDVNPWVWVITFEKISREEALDAGRRTKTGYPPVAG